MGVGLAACDVRSTADKAKAGDPQAEYAYALYDYGGEQAPPTPGADRTYVPRFTWMLRAAQGGYEPAFSQVASDYQNGLGTAVNLAEAARWRQRCAALHDWVCELALADMLNTGEGVPKDVVQGYAWMVICDWDAQSAKHAWLSSVAPPKMQADDELAHLTAALTPAQVAAGRKQAIAWRPEVAGPPPASG
jgi:TPR repeat protein